MSGCTNVLCPREMWVTQCLLKRSPSTSSLSQESASWAHSFFIFMYKTCMVQRVFVISNTKVECKVGNRVSWSVSNPHATNCATLTLFYISPIVSNNSWTKTDSTILGSGRWKEGRSNAAYLCCSNTIRDVSIGGNYGCTVLA